MTIKGIIYRFLIVLGTAPQGKHSCLVLSTSTQPMSESGIITTGELTTVVSLNGHDVLTILHSEYLSIYLQTSSTLSFFQKRLHFQCMIVTKQNHFLLKSTENKWLLCAQSYLEHLCHPLQGLRSITEEEGGRKDEGSSKWWKMPWKVVLRKWHNHCTQELSAAVTPAQDLHRTGSTNILLQIVEGSWGYATPWSANCWPQWEGKTFSSVAIPLVSCSHSSKYPLPPTLTQTILINYES